MRGYGRALGLLSFVALGMDCGADPSVLPAERWGAEFAAAECARIFACCDSREQTRWSYADEAQCRRDAASPAQEYLDGLLSNGWVSYDAKMARRCVDEIATIPCTDLVAVGKNLFGPSCLSISRGTGKIGTTCEDLDVVCESSNCESGSGTCGPTRGCTAICAAGQFCDPMAQACAPLKTEGVACTATGECAFPLTCQSSGVCAALRPGGAACGSTSDCASAACSGGVCDPMMCDGA